MAFIQTKKQIEKNFSESDWMDLGVLTASTGLITKHPRLLRSLSFGDPDYGACIIDVLDDLLRRDLGSLQVVIDFVRERYPGETDGDVLISSDAKTKRRIVFAPTVFEIPDGDPDTKLISVMMPFSLNMQPVFTAIKEAATEASYDCQRADDIWNASAVIQDVFALIYRSHIVVCDFSGRNPNVFYEAGIAHTLGKHVVPITQSSDDIPFDLRHHRYANYLNNSEGLGKLKPVLVKRFTELAKP